jgi:prevent-host-death family protein
MNHHSRTWPLQEAKAKFSELVRLAQTDGPQTVTVHGQPSVLVTKIPDATKDMSQMTGAEFIAAMRRGQLFDFEMPPRPLHWPADDFSFDDDDEQS